MVSNEKDTNQAYENMISHTNKLPDANEILVRGLADERRHKQWLEGQLNR